MQVFDYVASKADWFARGLPREGKRPASPQVGDLVRRDAPLCHLADRVGEVVQRVQLYTLPELLPPVRIAASGTRSAHLAGRIGDGLITVGIHTKLVDRFMAAGGTEKPRYTELNICWAPEEVEARRLAHARWPIAGLQGALLSDLRLPSHFAQAASVITEDEIAQAVIYGPDPAPHIAAITQAAEAGYTHVWVHQIGPDQAGFFQFYAQEVLPKFCKAWEE